MYKITAKEPDPTLFEDWYRWIRGPLGTYWGAWADAPRAAVFTSLDGTGIRSFVWGNPTCDSEDSSNIGCSKTFRNIDISHYHSPPNSFYFLGITTDDIVVSFAMDNGITSTTI
ncbi:MAG: hypothetical protein ACK46D_14975, partial [Roseiflexaceae bacterium]